MRFRIRQTSGCSPSGHTSAKYGEGGRPAASFRYNSGFRMVLVIYMHEFHGRDTAFYGVVNLRGEVVAREEQMLSEVGVDSFDARIRRFLGHFPQIRAICFGIPGVEVNEELVISDYELLRGQSLSRSIRDKFQLPVLVENDVNAAVMGYCQQHDIRRDQCVIGLYFPDKYPPGAGIYLNGALLKGRNGLAGEIKYLPLGIDWVTFDYHPEEWQEVMVKTIWAFCCMCNPDRIVLYGDSINEAVPELILERYRSTVEQLLLPDITISTDLNRDFEAGIKRIALHMIEM